MASSRENYKNRLELLPKMLPDTVDFVNKSALLCELSNEKKTAVR